MPTYPTVIPLTLTRDPVWGVQIDQGASIAVLATLINVDTGDPVDVTGWSATLTVATLDLFGVPVLPVLLNVDGDLSGEPADGVFRFTLDAADTQTLPVGGVPVAMSIWALDAGGLRAAFMPLSPIAIGASALPVGDA